MFVVPKRLPVKCCDCEYCTDDMECMLLDYKEIPTTEYDAPKLRECPLIEVEKYTGKLFIRKELL